jgi:hypothetical protein
MMTFMMEIFRPMTKRSLESSLNSSKLKAHHLPKEPKSRRRLAAREQLKSHRRGRIRKK